MRVVRRLRTFLLGVAGDFRVLLFGFALGGACFLTSLVSSVAETGDGEPGQQHAARFGDGAVADVKIVADGRDVEAAGSLVRERAVAAGVGAVRPDAPLVELELTQEVRRDGYVGGELPEVFGP